VWDDPTVKKPGLRWVAGAGRQRGGRLSRGPPGEKKIGQPRPPRSAPNFRLGRWCQDLLKVLGLQGFFEQWCGWEGKRGLSPRRKSVGAVPPDTTDRGAARTRLGVVASPPPILRAMSAGAARTRLGVVAPSSGNQSLRSYRRHESPERAKRDEMGGEHRWRARIVIQRWRRIRSVEILSRLRRPSCRWAVPGTQPD